MCYILYGVVNEDVNAKDYEQISNGSKYTFKLGTKHDLKECIVDQTYEYRVTKRVCDCDFPVGLKDPTAPELKELAEALGKFKELRNIKCVYLCKTWTGKRNKKEETLHIDDMDVAVFLADMEFNCLYRIDLYPRFDHR